MSVYVDTLSEMRNFVMKEIFAIEYKIMIESETN